VIAAAVGFDDQLLPAPQEVDAVAPDAGVDLRRRETVAATKREEAVLELAEGALGELRVGPDGDALLLGGSDRVAQGLGRGDPPQVGEGSPRRGRRDALLLRGLRTLFQ
jgi:hypothetical protein